VCLVNQRKHNDIASISCCLCHVEWMLQCLLIPVFHNVFLASLILIHTGRTSECTKDVNTALLTRYRNVTPLIFRVVASIVVVEMLTEMKREQKDKQNTLLSNCKSTANTYKSIFSQDNKHQAKFKLTQEIKSDSFSHVSTKSNDICDKHQLQHNQKYWQC